MSYNIQTEQGCISSGRGPRHLAQCIWKVVYIMIWFSTSLAMIHYGSWSLCPYCALATKSLHIAGPKRLNLQSTLGDCKARELCVGSERATLVNTFSIYSSSFEQINCVIKCISEHSSADMWQASTVTIPSCTINQ